jgi:hypothetical protein
MVVDRGPGTWVGGTLASNTTWRKASHHAQAAAAAATSVAESACVVLPVSFSQSFLALDLGSCCSIAGHRGCQRLRSVVLVPLIEHMHEKERGMGGAWQVNCTTHTNWWAALQQAHWWATTPQCTRTQHLRAPHLYHFLQAWQRLVGVRSEQERSESLRIVRLVILPHHASQRCQRQLLQHSL